MRISVTIFVILISTCIVNASVLDPVIENIVHRQATKPPGEISGMWKKKTVWKPRWVKEWKSAKVTKPVWRKVWSPIQIREWVPVPKPPPGWDAISIPLASFHAKPQRAPVKDSQGHDSFPAHSATSVPLWDPVPYPESQQPPPPPPPGQLPLQNTDDSCAKGVCDNTPLHTFNHQQILEILGSRYQQPGDYFQNPEYSETVSHLTRLPPEGNNWGSPQPLPDIQIDNRFNSFPGLPEFLIPPKTQPGNDFRLQLPNNQKITTTPKAPLSELQNIPQWNGFPRPPANKIKGHFIIKSPDQPYKFEFPESRNQNNTKQTHQNSDKSNFQKQNISSVLFPKPDGDFIQEAQLVGEYHYSEFDLPAIKQDPNKSQPNLQEQAKPKFQHKLNQVKPQRPLAKQQPVVENKPKSTQEDEQQNSQGTSHIQKKHISPPSSKSNHNFQKQEALVKEIFPVFKPLQPVNQTHALNHQFELHTPSKNPEKIQNHSSTKLIPIGQNHRANLTNFQQQKAYPVFERPQGINSNNLPSNHGLSLNPEKKHQEKPNLNGTKPHSQSNLANIQQQRQVYPIFEIPSSHGFSPMLELKQLKKPLPTQNSTKLFPVPGAKPDSPIFNKASSVQLVFATAPNDKAESQKDYQKTTTTEPYEILFSSSLLSTTEAVTKSPVIIVTPINSKS